MADGWAYFIENHSLPLIIGAIGVCAVTAWLLLVLIGRARGADRRAKIPWIVLAALVGGLGLWATHVIATLGFRPDVEFLFNVERTAWSAFLGIVAVGIPAALTGGTRHPAAIVIGGAFAGAGVAILHHIGIASVTRLEFGHGAAAIIALSLTEATLFGAALLLASRQKLVLATGLIVVAVCVGYFIGVTRFRIVPVFDETDGGLDQTTLGLIVGIITSCLLLAAAILLASSARLAEKERQKALMSTALDNMSNGLLLIGANGRIELFNDRLGALFGIRGSDVAIGMRWQTFLANLSPHLGWSPQRLARVIENHALWLARDDVTYVEHAMDDGRTISVACRPMDDGGAVLTYDDVTVERLALKEIERLAFLDPLTGLANRRAFQKTLEETLAARTPVTLLLIDLDRFKSVNDTLGHAAGDELLLEVGRRICESCTRGEFVSRLAGDEFVVLCRTLDPDRTTALCDAIVASLGAPFLIEGRPVVTGCSVGIASAQEPKSASVLVQQADLALYKAKALGRGRSQRYEAGMQEAAAQRARMEDDLRAALAANEFHLVFQPLYGLSDASIFGFEALVRWHHPEKGPVSPEDFIPIAEDTGLIREIGLWILTESCRQVAQWPEGIHVAVNVSPVQLRNELFPLQLAATLNAAGLTPDRLQIELTETALVSDSDQIALSLRSLRDLGICIAMDDFGTGYSSFAHLRDFDLDWIKIDQSFVQAAPTDESAAAVLRAVVQMANGLGVGTIAEGVETGEQLALLRDMGCKAAQGYLLGRPMSADDALDLCYAGRTRAHAARGPHPLGG